MLYIIVCVELFVLGFLSGGIVMEETRVKKARAIGENWKKLLECLMAQTDLAIKNYDMAAERAERAERNAPTLSPLQLKK